MDIWNVIRMDFVMLVVDRRSLISHLQIFVMLSTRVLRMKSLQQYISSSNPPLRPRGGSMAKFNSIEISRELENRRLLGDRVSIAK